jgi:hypothetical protein
MRERHDAEDLCAKRDNRRSSWDAEGGVGWGWGWGLNGLIERKRERFIISLKAEIDTARHDESSRSLSLSLSLSPSHGSPPFRELPAPLMPHTSRSERESVER